MLDPLFDRIRRLHDEYARLILASIATMLVPLMALTLVATVDNWQQNQVLEANAKVQDRLLECFDDFAAAQSTTSKAVREASAVKDAATAEREDALNAEGVAFLRLSRQILNDDVTRDAFQDLVDTLEARKAASRELDRAQAALDEARRENPVPEPPSQFCAVQP